MAEKNDGGQAFPVQKYEGSWLDGMSLRDYFAAKAMQGIASGAVIETGELPNEEDPALVAEAAYAIADAMLKARQA